MLVITLLFIIILISLRYVWFKTITIPKQVSIEQGVLDLREWLADSRSMVALNGEWNFYPDQWMSQEQEGQFSPDLNAIQVPGPWKNVNENGSLFGYGTYRLKIRLPDMNVSYGMWISDIRTAYRLYVNGDLLHESGHPSASPESHVSRIVPYVQIFPPAAGNELDIALEVDLNAMVGYEDIILNPHATYAWEINTRFDCVGHTFD